MNWKAVLRDALIVLGLTFLGGMAVGFAFGVMGVEGSPKMQLGLVFSNFIFGIVGFAIAGSLSRVERFRHLLVVAVIVWILSILNVPLAGATLVQWLWALPFLLVVMGIGGGISFLFVRTPKTPDVKES